VERFRLARCADLRQNGGLVIDDQYVAHLVIGPDSVEVFGSERGLSQVDNKRFRRRFLSMSPEFA